MSVTVFWNQSNDSLSSVFFLSRHALFLSSLQTLYFHKMSMAFSRKDWLFHIKAPYPAFYSHTHNSFIQWLNFSSPILWRILPLFSCYDKGKPRQRESVSVFHDLEPVGSGSCFVRFFFRWENDRRRLTIEKVKETRDNGRLCGKKEQKCSLACAAHSIIKAYLERKYILKEIQSRRLCLGKLIIHSLYFMASRTVLLPN